ncbi:MAG: fatty acid alpha-hydroxylase [Cirrosporium novae-zelandiae]|nr:MAG: fatty acid alpha-hydroxylase [Cirrosporium novae-zelandiae]
MPGRTLPTITLAEVQGQNTAKSCYVTVGPKVYDITDFLDDHPGGGDLILEHAGKDITEILKDEISHTHSETAYEILDDHLIGFVATEQVLKTAVNSQQPASILPLPPTKAGLKELEQNEAIVSEDRPLYPATGMSTAEDLIKETDIRNDYKKFHFLDLDRPLFPQVWLGGFKKDFYLEQVHRPRHYRGGASAPLFGNFLEPLSKTPWWLVPICWVPPTTYGAYLAFSHLPIGQATPYLALGLFAWTLVEYLMHRFLFHMEKYLPDNRVGITLHFVLHGVHHYLPMDKYRLVMPPTLFLVLATPWYRFAHFAFSYNWYAGTAVFCGAVYGYIMYDLTHYFLHHKALPPWYKELKKWHLEHHFADYNNGFGVTSKMWDIVFGTMIIEAPKPMKVE